MIGLPGMPRAMAALVEQLATLPGLGPKSATRMALHLLAHPATDAEQLAHTLASLHQQVSFCPDCGCFAEATLCRMCAHPRRDHSLICIVEQPVDVLMLEQGQTFAGVYHVLHGRLSPVDGVGPEQLWLDGLDRKVQQGKVRELVLATSATVDGEASAHFIAHRYAAHDVRISRIARGVPEGGELEYLDQHTLRRAMDQRVPWPAPTTQNF